MPQPNDKDWANEYKNKTHYLLLTRDSLQIKRLIQSESEGIVKGILHTWKSKENQVAMHTSEKTDLKEYYER